MANGRSGGKFNKFLNFIGLVDEQPDAREGKGTAPERGGSAAQRSGAQSGTQRKSAYENRPSSGENRFEPRTERTSYSSSPRSTASSSGRPYYDSPRSGGGARSEDKSVPYRAQQGAGSPAKRSVFDDDDDEFWDTGERPSAPAPRREAAPSAPVSTPRGDAQPAARETGYGANMSVSGSRHQTVIFQLEDFEECKNVILALIDNKSVLINLDQLNDVLVQRAVDTMCGAAFAVGAALRKISDRTYLIAPSSVSITNGDDVGGGSQRRYY